jgi:hypothetical protein
MARVPDGSHAPIQQNIESLVEDCVVVANDEARATFAPALLVV